MSSPSFSIPPQPPKVPEWRKAHVWIQSLTGTIFGGALMFLALSAVRNFGAWDAVALCITLPVLLWMQILVHEAGHAVAGMVAGHSVLAIGIGPLRAERGGGAWRIRWSGHVRSIAGFVLLQPRRAVQRRWESTVYLLGGPLANFLVAALALQWAHPDIQQGATIGHAIARLAVGTGVLIGAVNLIPFLVGGWSSDGRQLLKLWQGSAESRALLFIRQLGALSATGSRPRDWPLGPIKDLRLTDLPQGVADMLAQCFLYKSVDEHSAQSAEAFAAARVLANGFWYGPEATRPSKALLLARWSLDCGLDPDTSGAWAAYAEGGIVDQSGELAALRAMIALRLGNHLEAKRHYLDAVALRHRVQAGVGVTMFDEDMAILKERLSKEKGEISIE